MKDTLLDLLEDLLMTIYLPLVLLLGVWGLMLVIWCGRVYSAPNRRAFITWSLRNNAITNRLFRRWLYYRCPGCGEYFTGLVKRDRGWYCSGCHERLDRRFRDWVAERIDTGHVPPTVMIHRLKMKGTMDAARLWIVVIVLIFVYVFVRVLSNG